MKAVGLLSNDVELQGLLDKTDRFASVDLITPETLNSGLYDIYIISDQIMSFTDVKKYTGENHKKQYFYMVSSENFTNLTQAVVQSGGLVMVPPKLTPHQVSDYIVNQLGNDLVHKNEVFTFFGADTKVGTTMLAQSVAKHLSDFSENVLFIPLDGNFGDDYVKFDGKFGLGDLKSKLQTQIASGSELREACVKTSSGYYVLPGLKSILTKQQFHPKHIAFLVEMMREQFDVVLLDAGSNIELGMAISALNATPNRILVTTQQPQALKRFKQVQYQVLNKLSVDKFLLVVNKYVDTSALSNAGLLEKEYGFPLVASLPYMEYGWQCEQEQTTLYEFKDDLYKSGVVDIAKVISSHLNKDWVGEETKRKGIIHKLFGRSKDVKDYGKAL